MSAEHVATTGYGAHASTTGNEAHASTTGNGANASTTGELAHASTTGNGAHASTTGELAHASTTGDEAAASTTGELANASTAGNGAIASATGNDGWAKAGQGGTIVLAYDDGVRRRVLVAYPCETPGIPANTWCHVIDGKIVADPTMLLPDDGREYSLRCVAGRYLAGCRNFDRGTALAHWSNPDHKNTAAAARLYAAVLAHEVTA
jgi:hypothetical protein